MRYLIGYIFALLVLSACQQVPINNSTWYGSLGPDGAQQLQLLTPGEQTLTLLQWAAVWNDLANPLGPMVCTNTSTLTNLKGDMETLCSWNPTECNVEVQQAIAKISGIVDNMTTYVNSKKTNNNTKP